MKNMSFNQTRATGLLLAGKHIQNHGNMTLFSMYMENSMPIVPSNGTKPQIEYLKCCMLSTQPDTDIDVNYCSALCILCYVLPSTNYAVTKICNFTMEPW